jgi:hypothetical protein
VAIVLAAKALEKILILLRHLYPVEDAMVQEYAADVMALV